MCAYAVLKLHYTPSQFNNLPQNEKAFVIAAIEIQREENEKQR